MLSKAGPCLIYESELASSSEFSSRLGGSAHSKATAWTHYISLP